MLQYWFIFSQGNLFLQELSMGHYSIPLSEQIPFGSATEAMKVAYMNDCECMCIELPSTFTDCPKGFLKVSLRSSYQYLDNEFYLMAGKAEELLNWHLANRFCGYCGAPLQFNSQISKICPNCHREQWPKLSPAIIVLILKEDEVLLVQSKAFKYDYYGLVAGFVETGESLEDCVYREVKEETNLEITDLKYFGSQPWPYPRNLMIGFTAKYLRGELHFQESEIRKGGWFRRDNMPTIPEKLSISRRLIDYWYNLDPIYK